MLTKEYIFDALQAEREGVPFPIDYDAVWESFGFTRHNNAIAYLNRNFEILAAKGLASSLHDKYHSDKTNKFLLSVKGCKFALARAKTERGDSNCNLISTQLYPELDFLGSLDSFGSVIIRFSLLNMWVKCRYS